MNTIDFEGFCGRGYETPFNYEDEFGKWVVATNGYVTLIIRPGLVDKGYNPSPQMASLLKKVLDDRKPVLRSFSISRTHLINWAAAGYDPKIGILTRGVTIDKALLYRTLVKTPKGSNQLVVKAYGERDPAQIIDRSPSPNWYYHIMPYIDKQLVVTDSLETTVALTEGHPVEPLPAIAPSVVSSSKHLQALQQLQSSAVVRNRAGQVVDRWGNPILPKYHR